MCIHRLKEKSFYATMNKYDAKTQYAIGINYHTGNRVKKDDVEALKWIRNAAQLGVSDAELELGFFYEKGLAGLSEDKKQALHWYLKAAKQGNPRAEYNIALFFDPDDNDSNANKYFREASNRIFIHLLN